MAVDAAWLESVRRKNQAAFGMGGLGYTFVSSEGIVGKGRRERELRTQSIHRGRFEERDPYRPTEGSIESIAEAIGPANVPVPQRIGGNAKILFGVVALGLVGFILYKFTTRGG